MKTLAIRLEDGLHAQMSVIAQIDGTSITEEIRQAIEAHINAKKAQPELTAKADAILAELEREATDRRTAINALFTESTDDTPAPAAPARTSRKRASEEPATG